MNVTFFDGHDELYHHEKFRKDRTMRAGYMCENMVFFVFCCCSLSESEAPCVRGEHSSNKHYVAVYCPILNWNMSYQRLFFQMHYIVFIFVARWRHNFREIAVKKLRKLVIVSDCKSASFYRFNSILKFRNYLCCLVYAYRKTN